MNIYVLIVKELCISYIENSIFYQCLLLQKMWCYSTRSWGKVNITRNGVSDIDKQQVIVEIYLNNQLNKEYTTTTNITE